ncbi:MAG TPA: type III pantothenate kinase [Chitinolyticbacter sp.]|nr:type III pantothenate kinase [Chitinolyticbacter sp.]
MSVLLIDLGNTRLKWALADSAHVWSAQGSADPAALPELFAQWRALAVPRQVQACSVGTEATMRELEAFCHASWGVSIDWLRVGREALGVSNRYRQLEQQGPDRWAAVLGARCAHPDQALVIASAGTALTVDALTADGCFLGGMILPGYRMMKSALAVGTARLPDASGRFHDFPTSTEDAIETGVLTALAGSIAVMFERLQARGEEPLVLISGGDAALLAPHLGSPCRLIDHLALRGLAALAFNGDVRP